MAPLSRVELRRHIEAKMAALGAPITREQCEAVLKDMAHVGLPRAAIDPADAGRVLDLYHALLRDAGMTRPLMVEASKRFIMAPRKGKTRYFPDPGELAEQVRDELTQRKRSILAFLRAIEVIDTPEPEQGQAIVPDIQDRLKALGEQLSTRKPFTPRAASLVQEEPPAINTARPNTDAAELRAALQRRTTNP